ncbi:MAG TPA: cytochrome c biogenesis protein CcdA [Planctomycetota bacterium]|nr:cytochrome c biogenesis protein CcdA [Planctomycetota bacterium]
MQPLLTLLFAGLSLGSLGSQDPKAQAKLYARADGDQVRALVRIELDPGWHLYHEDLGPPGAVGQPTTLEWTGFAEKPATRFPKPIRLQQPAGIKPDWILAHEGRLDILAEGELAPDAKLEDLEVTVRGLTCDENGCLPYAETAKYAGRGPDSVFADFPAGLGAAGGAASTSSGAADASAGEGQLTSMASEPPALLGEGLLAFILASIAGGLFALVMPCTYPMIPITISFVTKRASERPGKQLSLSLVYGAGIVVIFILIAVVVGEPIAFFAAHPVTNLVIGLLFVLFALALFGVVDLQPPRFLLNTAGRASMVGGYLGVFLMGATLVITSFTCTAPVVGALLAIGVKGDNLLHLILGMGTFGLTMAVPFVFLSLVPGKLSALPKSGEWMHVIKVTLGFVELAAALKFISNVDLAWKWGVLSRELFLLLWFGIFLVAALFLFGIIRLQGEKEHAIGPVRMVTATAVLLFALYCGYGTLGHRLDWIMSAIAPPYSGELTDMSTASRRGEAQVGGHVIVKDDYDEALRVAIASGKQVLVNFTGFA